MIKTVTRRLASPVIVLTVMPWLIFLLITGTIAQKDLGIYAAQELFFSSWILWLGPIPLPGAYPTLGLLTLGLLAKFLLYSPWSIERAGTILTHLGILVLLIGGLVTSMTQREGFLILGEGKSSNAVSDYHDRVLRVEKDGIVIAILPFKKLAAHKDLPVDLPFTVQVESVCENCRPAPVKNPEGRKGLAEQITLFADAPEKENEANMSGITFSITGADDTRDGIYVALEDVPHRPSVEKGGSVYSFIMSRRQTLLPFDIELSDFQKEMHPGTNVARSYSSDIVVHDGGIAWPYHIRMNEPLRYKGYTFYQASFAVRPDGEVSILSVVENKGRIFPYAASVLIFAGLLTHLVLRLRSKRAA